MSTRKPFAGIRIIELAEDVSGEYCGKLLADFGAEVIKLEQPCGSPVRSLSPFGKGEAPENSALFAYLNTNKRSVVLDTDTVQGKALLERLLDTADAVIDDHAPGWLAAHGLDPARLADERPNLTVCSITPFGQNAPAERRHATDLTVFHASGWGYHTPSGNDGSRVPLKGAGRFLVSYEAALDAALCIASALYDRESGGRFIDIAGNRAMFSRLDYVLAQMLIGDMDVTTAHTAFDLGGPASILPCRDGFIYIWLSGEEMWQALRAMLPGDTSWMDEDFPENWLQLACTPERVARTRRHLGEWLAGIGKHEAAEQAQKRGVMIVPLNNPGDLMENAQFRFRGYFAKADHPVLGEVMVPTVPYRMSATPAAIETPAPLLGAATQAVLAAMGDTR